jgi:hypothetical protein
MGGPRSITPLRASTYVRRMATFRRFEVARGPARLVGEHAGRGPALLFLHAGVARRGPSSSR